MDKAFPKKFVSDGVNTSLGGVVGNAPAIHQGTPGFKSQHSIACLFNEKFVNPPKHSHRLLAKADCMWHCGKIRLIDCMKNEYKIDLRHSCYTCLRQQAVNYMESGCSEFSERHGCQKTTKPRF